MNEDEKIETAGEDAEDGFLDGWEDAESTGAAEPEAEPDAPAEPESLPEEPDAPQESAGGTPEEEAAPDDAAPPEPAQPPRTWTLNRQGQPVTVDENGLAALAQRGLEYDGLRAEVDESRPIMDLFRSFAEQAGMPPREYLTALRMQAMQSRGLSQEDARRAVELENREASVRRQEAAEQARQTQIRQAQEQARNLEARRRAEVREFLAVFPDAAKTQLPKEVWDGVHQGLSLTAAYARYANAQAAEAARAAEDAAKQAEEIRKQNAANAARSAGSMRTAGTDHGPKDPFLAGWDED